MQSVTVTHGTAADLESAAARPGDTKNERRRTNDERCRAGASLSLPRRLPSGAPFVVPRSTFVFCIAAHFRSFPLICCGVPAPTGRRGGLCLSPPPGVLRILCVFVVDLQTPRI